MSTSSRYHSQMKHIDMTDDELRKEILRLYRESPRYSKSKIRNIRETLNNRKKATQLLLKE